MRVKSMMIAVLGLGFAFSSSTQADEFSVEDSSIDKPVHPNNSEPSVREVIEAFRHAVSESKRSLQQLARRARNSGWVPTLRTRVRLGRAQDVSTDLRDVTDRWDYSSDDDLVVEGWLWFRFDRTVYHSDEARLQSEHRRRQDRLDGKVQQLVRCYYRRRRLIDQAALEGWTPASFEEAQRAQTLIDVATGYQFTHRWRRLGKVKFP